MQMWIYLLIGIINAESFLGTYNSEDAKKSLFHFSVVANVHEVTEDGNNLVAMSHSIKKDQSPQTPRGEKNAISNHFLY